MVYIIENGRKDDTVAVMNNNMYKEKFSVAIQNAIKEWITRKYSKDADVCEYMVADAEKTLCTDSDTNTWAIIPLRKLGENFDSLDVNDIDDDDDEKVNQQIKKTKVIHTKSKEKVLYKSTISKRVPDMKQKKNKKKQKIENDNKSKLGRKPNRSELGKQKGLEIQQKLLYLLKHDPTFESVYMRVTKKKSDIEWNDATFKQACLIYFTGDGDDIVNTYLEKDEEYGVGISKDSKSFIIYHRTGSGKSVTKVSGADAIVSGELYDILKHKIATDKNVVPFTEAVAAEHAGTYTNNKKTHVIIID